MSEINRVALFFNKTSGRDQFSKSIQFLSRLLMHFTKKSKPELSARLNILCNTMADARKLFRLFKTINEYQLTKDFIDKPPADWDELDFLFNILIRLGFAGYWVFDNLFILSNKI